MSFSLRRVQRIPFTLISFIYNECTKKIAVREENEMRGKASMSSIIWRVKELEIT